MKQLTEIDYPLTNVLSTIITKIMMIDENKYIDFKLYKKDDTGTLTRISISSEFDLSRYEQEMGSIQTPVYTVLADGTQIEWKPFFNQLIEHFLCSQGLGTTEVCIPFVTELDGKCYVFTSDGACGDSLVEFETGKYQNLEICQLISDHHFHDDEDDEDE